MYHYKIDFTDCKTLWEIHEEIRVGLELHDWYGKNLDAFWDSITGLIGWPCTIEVRGKNEVPLSLQDEINRIIELLFEAKLEYGNIFPKLID